MPPRYNRSIEDWNGDGFRPTISLLSVTSNARRDGRLRARAGSARRRGFDF